MSDAVSPVVVTGASGFVGDAVVRALVRRGFVAIGVSRRGTAIVGAQMVRVADYRETPCPRSSTLIHLAEEATIPVANARGPHHIEEVRTLAAALIAKGFRRIVYASSGQIYRAGTSNPPYIAAKLAAEALVLSSGGAVARLANVYGPGMRNRTLIGDILRQIPGEGPLRIQSASPRRDFLWIDDAAEGLIAIAQGDVSGIFDLGSGTIVSAGELAKLALTAAGEADRPIVADSSGSKDDVIFLDIGPLRAAFGWQPKMRVNAGIAQLVGRTS